MTIKKPKYKLVAVACLCFVFSACSSAPAKQTKPAPVSNKSVESNTTYNKTASVRQQDYQTDQVIADSPERSRADDLIKRSEKVPNDIKATMQIRAAELYIEGNDEKTAQEVVNSIDESQLSNTQQSQYSVLRAKSLVDSAKYQEALNTLAKIRFGDFNSSLYQSEYLLNVSRALIGSIKPDNQAAKLKKTTNAMDALLKREAYLTDERLISQNRNELLQITDTLTAQQLVQIHKTTPSAYLKIWLENHQKDRLSLNNASVPVNTAPLTGTADNTFGDTSITSSELIQDNGAINNASENPSEQFVQQPYEEHALNQPEYALQPELVAGSNGIASVWQENSPKRIALLLPLSSKFSSAARTFEDGFKTAHRKNPSQNKPTIGVYDIDRASDVIDVVYRAISEGADYIVGPLGRQSAQRVLDSNSSSVPIMALGGAINSPSSSQSVFTLSPEQEAFAIAQHAISKGYRQAAVLAPADANGARVKAAFENGMQAFGGTVVSSADYTPSQFDHGEQIKQLLAINSSESRHQSLSSTLGFRPKFNPARRSDVDFLLLVGKSAAARVIKPQLSFHQAHSLPTYATSSAFSGNIDKANDADLENIIFPEMPWLLDQLSQGSQSISRSSRLFAFGHDVYDLLPIMNDLKGYSGTSFSGLTGQLSVNSRGEVMRLPGWARFQDGVPTPFETYGSSNVGSHSVYGSSTRIGQSQVPINNQRVVSPTTETTEQGTNVNQNTVINRSSRYDSQTWNARKNRRTQNP